jgi:hypothetical protein
MDTVTAGPDSSNCPTEYWGKSKPYLSNSNYCTVYKNNGFNCFGLCEIILIYEQILRNRC